MLKMPKICALNAKYSNRQYRCTFTGVSNYIKISTVVDLFIAKAIYQFQITSKFLLL